MVVPTPGENVRMIVIHGFELVEKREIAELNTRGVWYRHQETGAELLSMENDEENKVFCVTLRTPPADSTGLPHILEHSVLCGSRKYPVKEPFIELAKGSLNTYLNAMTFPDKTIYPVASQNLQDFYNLIDVYLDAVFFPRITPETFAQEGWHYELEHPDGPMTYKGVVYNEMKGEYSSPESIIARQGEYSLFDDHVYALDSGGDPAVIPQLTYEQFKSFHGDFYHPSNARFFFYGNDDPEKRLQLVQEFIRGFSRHPVDGSIPLQKRRTAPVRLVQPYPVSNDAESSRAWVALNWLLPENSDPALTFALTVLGHILVGTPASPLRKALIDSGLGEDVIGTGLDDSLRELIFSTGLQGVPVEDTHKVEELVFSALKTLVADGVDPDLAAASVNTVEFRLREQNFGSFPRGLVVALNALSTWLHDGDPFGPVAFEAPLAAMKRGMTDHPHYFEDLIREHLLENPHRTTLVLEPDATCARRVEEAEKEKLELARAAMTLEERQAIVENTARLQALQEAPDPPEALATIPRLSLADLDREIMRIPTAEVELAGARVLVHDLFTNGIVYLDVGLDLHALPQDLLPLGPLFGEALLNMGTSSADFVQMTLRIGQDTGGIDPVLFHSPMRTSGQSASRLFLRGKATVDRAGELLGILRDVLMDVRLDHPERFMQLLLETKARVEASLVSEGHRVALSRLRSRFGEAYWATEATGGVQFLFFLRQLIEEARDNWPSVLARLEDIRETLVNRDALVVNVTLDNQNMVALTPQLEAFLEQLPCRGTGLAAWTCPPFPAPEGLAVPSQVNFVGKGANLFSLGYVRHGSMEVILNTLRTTWLWEKIRVQGGAYGAFCTFDSHGGVFCWQSYRDPNLLGTLKNYDGASGFLRQLDIPGEELAKSIIGAIGNLDSYQPPDAKGFAAMARTLIGYDDAARQQYRDELFATTTADFVALADVLDRVNATGEIVVLASPDALQAAQRDGGPGFTITKLF